MGWRAAAGFADADADAREEQLKVVLHETAEGGHAAPDEQREGHDVAAVAAIGPARDGDARGDVEDREGEARQQAELAVGQRQLRLDRLLQDGEQLPVDEVEGVYNGEQSEGIPAGGGAAVGVVRVLLRRSGGG